MRAISTILQEAGLLAPGFHIYIENPPWMPLHIEETGIPGPHGFRSISVAHYGEQNGDTMRDPEMIFEMELRGGVYVLSPYYWCNDYVGIEQYSSYRDDDGNAFVLAGLKRSHEQFAALWDESLRSQRFVEAFRRDHKPKLPN